MRLLAVALLTIGSTDLCVAATSTLDIDLLGNAGQLLGQVSEGDLLGSPGTWRTACEGDISVGSTGLRTPGICTIDTREKTFKRVSLQPAGNTNASGGGTNISADASCVVGFQDAGFFTPFHALRWTEAGGPVDLGTLDPANNASRSSSANGANRDCSVTVGFSDIAGGVLQHAFRWTAAGGMVDLGAPAGAGRTSRAYDVSGDGSVVVGAGDFLDSAAFSGVRNGAFRWTAAGGFQDLGALEPGFFSMASALSADGSVVVGQAGVSVTVGGSQTNGSRAFRWTQAGGLTPIGPLAGHQHATATRVSDNGKIVVGTSSAQIIDHNGIGGQARGIGTAFRWTQATGIQDLKAALVAAGANLTGITLVSATAMSADGQWIAGQATTPQTAVNETVAYVVQFCDDAVDSPCTIVAAAPFTVGASRSALTVPAGQSATTQISVTPAAGFVDPVTFACSGLPAGAACNFSPATVTPAGASVSTTLTISTDAGPVATLWRRAPATILTFALAPLGLIASGVVARRRHTGPSRREFWAMVLLLGMVALMIASCGGGGGSGTSGAPAGGNPTPPATGTPAGTSSVTVTGTSGSGATANSSSVPIALTVTR